MPILILALALLAFLLLWRSGRGLRAAGLPGARVIYADTRGWGRVEEPLFDPALALTGRPDYLVEERGRLIPVEVKSTAGIHSPYPAHMLQLAAYCLLTERVFGKRPPYGILHYPDRTYAVDYTPELEAELLDLLAEMRAWEGRSAPDRSHSSVARCRGCGFRSACDQRLF